MGNDSQPDDRGSATTCPYPMKAHRVYIGDLLENSSGERFQVIQIDKDVLETVLWETPEERSGD